MKSICLVLSGGGARGFAHAGVIKALDEFNVPVSKIIASSMGAVIGGKYAINKSAEEIIKLVESFTFNLDKYLDLKSGIKLKSPNLKAFFDSIYLGSDISNTRIPLELIVADFETSDLEIFTQGNLSTAVLASVSLPFLNNPVRINDKYYADPGLLSNFPIEFYKPQDGVLFGINAGSTKLSSRKKSSNFIDKLVKKDDIYHLIHSSLKLQNLHEVQKVKENGEHGIVFNLTEALNEFSSTDFHKSLEIIEAGYQYTLSRKDEILKIVQ